VLAVLPTGWPTAGGVLPDTDLREAKVDWNPSITVPIVVAVLGLLGAQFLAILSRRHDRQQTARAALVEPAREFARAAIEALAALRYVTPPATGTGQSVHRNLVLLTDVAERTTRLHLASVAIDAVRATRAGVRLAFHPKSWAAEYSRQVLAALRNSLESAEEFYAAHDEHAGSREWMDASAPELRRTYKQHRNDVYEALDRFFDDVAERLQDPTWNPRKIPRSEQHPGNSS
jgi:hypothetical protein